MVESKKHNENTSEKGTYSPDDLEILKLMYAKNLSQQEKKSIISQLHNTSKNIEVIDHKFYGNHLKYGRISDTHIGSKYFNEKLFLKSVSAFNKNKVSAIYCAGDLVEGMSNRDGHIYELSEIGITEQVKRASELLNLYKAPVYGITGNHELWASYKANQGVDVGDYLQDKCKNYTNLGQMEADLNLGDIILKLYHGQDGCFDDKTEILTKSGWKLFKNLNKNDKVATLNIKNNIFEWQLPTHYTNELYNGDMYEIKQQSLDFFITPSHKLLVKKYENRWKKHKFELKKVSHISKYSKQTYQIKKSGVGWKGVLTNYIEIPYLQSKNKGMIKRMVHIGKQSIYNIAELIGWYVTEGYIRKCLLSIAQHKSVNTQNYDEIKDLFYRMDIKFVEEKRKQYINVFSKELCDWLLQECGHLSKNKYLPEWLKNQPVEILKVVFATMIKGDGWIKGNDSFGYTSISKKLKTDMTEIAIKLGYSVTEFNNSLSISKNNPCINHKPIIKHYNGRIYCVTVPNHTILVRRNGKICWSGNSAYAPGYRGMKLIESFSGGEKPHILDSGHTHKYLEMFQRNIYYSECGCLQNRTPFQRGKKLMAHLGFSIVDIWFNSNGIIRRKSEFFPEY
jgi:predicted phosphodiesterase